MYSRHQNHRVGRERETGLFFLFGLIICNFVIFGTFHEIFHQNVTQNQKLGIL